MKYMPDCQMSLNTHPVIEQTEINLFIFLGDSLNTFIGKIP